MRVNDFSVSPAASIYGIIGSQCIFKLNNVLEEFEPIDSHLNLCLRYDGVAIFHIIEVM